MTTIAFKDGILAADSLATSGDVVTGTGASAAEAVRIACDWDIYTGGDVIALDFEEPAKP